MNKMEVFVTNPIELLLSRQCKPSSVVNMDVLQQERIKEKIVPCIIAAIKERYNVLTDDEAILLWDKFYNEVILSDER